MTAAHAIAVSYRILRELGARAHASFAAVRSGQIPGEYAGGRSQELVVVQRFRREEIGAEATALLLRDARALAKSWHPNLARVRHVDLIGSDLWIASEMIEGATLADLGTNIELPVLLRILVDVLHGLSHLHGLRDGMRQPLEAMHGELGPVNVVVGRDGVARVVNIFRPRPVRVGAQSEALHHAAPESLETEGTEDARSDLYAVGSMLWEGLAGRRRRTGEDPAAILQIQREEELPTIDADEALLAIALRAMAFDRSARFRSATEMAAELRSHTQRLAQGGAVAQLVNARALDRIRERRMELDPGGSGTRLRHGATSDPEEPDTSYAMQPAEPEVIAVPPSTIADPDQTKPNEKIASAPDTLPDPEPEGSRATIPDQPKRVSPAAPAWTRMLAKRVSPFKSNPPQPAPDEKVIVEAPRRIRVPTPGPISATLPPPALPMKRLPKIYVYAAIAAVCAAAVTFLFLDHGHESNAPVVAAPPEADAVIAKEPAKPKEVAVPTPIETAAPKGAVKEPEAPAKEPPPAAPVWTPSVKPKASTAPVAKPKKTYDPSEI